MSEVTTIGRQPFDRGLARAKHAFMIHARPDGVLVFDDVVGQLPVDRATKSVHARLLSAPLPEAHPFQSPGEYVASL
ncbi:MAG TPA: hypothetical protein VMP89_06070, partial [Solirubrobacteraceae bacterium]|nr:hypothetical protein [Solirubrobacteraceae bacterium]